MIQKLQSCLVCDVISDACKKLSNEELQYLSKACIDGKLQKGETFLRQGSISSTIIYIKSGLVKETMLGPGGKDQIFRILTDKSYIGMTSLFGNGMQHFSYTALSNLSICYIKDEPFTYLMKKNGEFSFSIMASLCKDNLNGSRKFLNQSQKKIYGKLADAILYFSDIIFEKKKFHLPLSRKEIANLIGTSRESASRTLQRFDNEGIIELKKNELKILEYKKLQEISRTG